MLVVLRLWHVIQSFSPSEGIANEETVEQVFFFFLVLLHRNLMLVKYELEKAGFHSFGYISRLEMKLQHLLCQPVLQ